MAVGLVENKIRVYDAKERTLVKAYKAKGNAWVRKMCFTPDASSLLVWQVDNSKTDEAVIRWSLKTGTTSVVYSNPAEDAPNVTSILALKSGKVVLGFHNGDIMVVPEK